MSVILESTLIPTPTGRKRWTRDDCLFFEATGRLSGRYELIDGEIILKVGQNAPHATTVMLVIAFFLTLFGARRVRTQATMEVRQDDQITNRPEPDILVLREGAERDRVPVGTDALLVVEVSDTTQGDDFGFKVGLYARAGVAEYWVLDLPRRVLVAFRDPDAVHGTWGERREFTENESVAVTAMATTSIRVADLID